MPPPPPDGYALQWATVALCVLLAAAVAVLTVEIACWLVLGLGPLLGRLLERYSRPVPLWLSEAVARAERVSLRSERLQWGWLDWLTYRTRDATLDTLDRLDERLDDVEEARRHRREAGRTFR